MLSPLVMATLLLFLLGAAAGLLLQKLPALANRLNSGFALLGSLAGLVAAIQIFAQGAPSTANSGCWARCTSICSPR